MKKSEEKLIMAYKQYLFDGGLAEKTIVSYVSNIRLYQNFLESIGETLTIEMKRQHIVQFKKMLMNDNKSTATINKAINSLFSFSGYLKTLNPDAQMVVNVTKDKIRVARGSESEVDVFSDDEISRILDMVSADKLEIGSSFIYYYIQVLGLVNLL